MAVSPERLDHILEQLSLFGAVNTKKMFGGVGLFHEGKMFGMLSADAFRLKVDEHNRADYEARGMQPHYSGSKKKGMPYWQVPEDALEDRAMLKQWADKAYHAAMNASK